MTESISVQINADPVLVTVSDMVSILVSFV